MRCQYNIKENLIKPLSTLNVVVCTGKNFSATGMICVWHLQFLSDGDTFQKVSKTPESLVIPISASASPGPPPKAKRDTQTQPKMMSCETNPGWVSRLESHSPHSQGVQPELLFGAVHAQLIPQPCSALGCGSQRNSWLSSPTSHPAPQLTHKHAPGHGDPSVPPRTRLMLRVS